MAALTLHCQRKSSPFCTGYCAAIAPPFAWQPLFSLFPLGQTIIELANKYESKERIAFVHETNDYQGETSAAFTWIKKYINRDDRVISLKFGSKQKFTQLQAADILAYEGNKRFRDLEKPPRKAK